MNTTKIYDFGNYMISWLLVVTALFLITLCAVEVAMTGTVSTTNYTSEFLFLFLLAVGFGLAGAAISNLVLDRVPDNAKTWVNTSLIPAVFFLILCSLVFLPSIHSEHTFLDSSAFILFITLPVALFINNLLRIPRKPLHFHSGSHTESSDVQPVP